MDWNTTFNSLMQKTALLCRCGLYMYMYLVRMRSVHMYFLWARQVWVIFISSLDNKYDFYWSWVLKPIDS